MRTSLLLLLLSTLSLPLWAANILVISSYHPEYLWDQSYNEGLRKGLQGEHKISHFYMDTKRHPREAFDDIAQRAIAFYLKSKPDLVVLGDDNAINYLANEIASLGTPVVFLGMNENPRLKGFVGHPKITGVLERPLLKRNISEISQMMGDYSLWQEAVLNAKKNGYQAIFLGLYHTLVDDNGKHVSEQTVLEWTSANTPVPLFCFWEFAVGKGMAIGGLELDGHDQGLQAASLINTILAGTLPRTISPRAALRGEYVFSKSELARWQLTVPDKWHNKIMWRE
ncbi:ABC transporter substrate-binding protein [Aeromonas veronii]|uniref:ABC transporter substrate-binding protein n=1 Tax=Aeromonas TaxID=642 RepID=UPI0038DF33B3